jgi:hypothetical protein
MATIKLYLLYQGSHPASVYVANLCQLVCDVDWNNNALLSAF